VPITALATVLQHSSIRTIYVDTKSKAVFLSALHMQGSCPGLNVMLEAIMAGLEGCYD
jgi:hypothetical protein